MANDSGFRSAVASVAPQGVLRKGLFDLLKAGGQIQWQASGLIYSKQYTPVEGVKCE